MLSTYIDAALHHATYEILPDNEQPPYFGRIEGIQGVWASAECLEACHEELKSTLEDWLLFSLRRNMSVPVIDGVDAIERQNQ